MMTPLRMDLFCRIIDNYGDIGVCWRLARQMRQALGWEVRLWVDDLTVFQRLAPSLDPRLPTQLLEGVQVCAFTPDRDWASVVPHELVIEAFACELPAPFKQALLARMPSALWLNLEYLSAEAWVEGCHGLASRQGGHVDKFFFFPGFTAATGGLLREPGVLDTRDHFQSSRRNARLWLEKYGIQVAEQDRVVSLFGYPQGDYRSLLQALAHPSRTVHLLQTAGLNVPLPIASDTQHLHRLPFLSQEEFDRLLWSTDLNLVRGEDSFVRAQWAGRPMLWHIYPQADNAHLDKLQAWLNLSSQPPPRQAIQLGWNAAPSAPDWAAQLQHAWTDEQAWAQWQHHSQSWTAQLSLQRDLATAIHDFYLKQRPQR